MCPAGNPPPRISSSPPIPVETRPFDVVVAAKLRLRADGRNVGLTNPSIARSRPHEQPIFSKVLPGRVHENQRLRHRFEAFYVTQ